MATTLTMAITSIPTQLWMEYISATSFKFLYRHTAYVCKKEKRKKKERKKKEKRKKKVDVETLARAVCA
jgi:multisubunit Na+/H+ antiporter MnhE subunit